MDAPRRRRGGDFPIHVPKRRFGDPEGENMSQLQVTAKLAVKPGQIEAFRRAAAACLESVRTKDTGTLQYDWFMSDDQTVCHVRETYESSDALLEHVGNLGDNLGQLLETADLKIDLYGSPSVELVEATAALPVRVYRHLQSM